MRFLVLEIAETSSSQVSKKVSLLKGIFPKLVVSWSSPGWHIAGTHYLGLNDPTQPPEVIRQEWERLGEHPGVSYPDQHPFLDPDALDASLRAAFEASGTETGTIAIAHGKDEAGRCYEAHLFGGMATITLLSSQGNVRFTAEPLGIEWHAQPARSVTAK